jgi:nucleoside-diphosphate-sugar epimerase
VLDGLRERVMVFRPSQILGRSFLTASLWRSAYLVSRIQEGEPVPAIDGGRNLIAPVYAADAAKWVVRGFDAPAVDGQVFNAVGGDHHAAVQLLLHRPRSRRAALARDGAVSDLPLPISTRRRSSTGTAPLCLRPGGGRLGHAPPGTPEQMLEETVRYRLDAGLVKDAAEQPLDDALVELLVRHAADLGELLARRAAEAR